MAPLPLHLFKSSFINNHGDVPPTYKEVSNIINKLKRNKAPGTDNIPAELVKYGGYILKRRMNNLILLIWSKEQLTTYGMASRRTNYIL
jgi:hypothetical protein